MQAARNYIHVTLALPTVVLYSGETGRTFLASSPLKKYSLQNVTSAKDCQGISATQYCTVFLPIKITFKHRESEGCEETEYYFRQTQDPDP